MGRFCAGLITAYSKRKRRIMFRRKSSGLFHSFEVRCFTEGLSKIHLTFAIEAVQHVICVLCGRASGKMA